jgi:hypothetical protein
MRFVLAAAILTKTATFAAAKVLYKFGPVAQRIEHLPLSY